MLLSKGHWHTLTPDTDSLTSPSFSHSHTHLDNFNLLIIRQQTHSTDLFLLHDPTF